MPPHGLSETGLVDQGEAREDGAERPPLPQHLLDGPLEVRLADHSPADQDVAEVLARDVAPGLDDLALSDGQPPPLPAVGDVDVARQAFEMGSAQQPKQPRRSWGREPVSAWSNGFNHGDPGRVGDAKRPFEHRSPFGTTPKDARPCVM